ncbi:3747_t:CDS:2 [Diversispora eburnea]|uniref:3747_t:CDS:1 n=1 Tax=Diversispora eburnea TaxID=1213867 RepID=A0A9N9FQQ1_9GLOM|nr:3747_t:CDS:2 [Diversispora eburnea]
MKLELGMPGNVCSLRNIVSMPLRHNINKHESLWALNAIADNNLKKSSPILQYHEFIKAVQKSYYAVFFRVGLPSFPCDLKVAPESEANIRGYSRYSPKPMEFFGN